MFIYAEERDYFQNININVMFLLIFFICKLVTLRD